MLSASRGGDVLGGLVVELDQHAHPGGALHQGGDGAGSVGSDDQVAFPVARARPGLRPRRVVRRC